MQIIDPGHNYTLDNFLGGVGAQTLAFIKKENLGEDTETTTDGTTNEEVLAVLIDRLQFLQAKSPCRENALVITKLEESLMWLEKRTADRIARGVEGTNSK